MSNNKSVICDTWRIDIPHYLHSDQGDTDTSMCLHVAECVSQGLKQIILRTVGSDVVILAFYVHLTEKDTFNILVSWMKHVPCTSLV